MKKTGRFSLVTLLSLILNGCLPWSGPSEEGLPPFCAPAAEETAVRWFRPKETGAPAAVVLVIHGLNLRPDRMGPIIGLLTGAGMEVMNLSLTGHIFSQNGEGRKKERMAAFRSVSYDGWFAEALAAYRRAKARSEASGLPLHFVGFSMGGLLGADLLASSRKVSFDRMVLLSPAFDLHPYNYMGRLFSPFPWLVIPSASSPVYRANFGTPMAGYNALFEAIAHLRENMGPKLNIPTAVFMDRGDELVSYRGVKRMVEAAGLDRWRFHPVEKDGEGAVERMRHLIIDERSLGPVMWKRMKEAMVRHLLGGSPM